MTIYAVEDGQLTNIANAIRSKTGGTDMLSLNEMVNEIESIEVGGDSLAELGNGTLIDYSSDKLKNIKSYLFYGNTNLRSVNLPNVTQVKELAFYQCSNLESVNLPNIIHMYGADVFGYCSKLTEISLPQLEKTYIYCFRYSSLQRVMLSNVTDIDDYSFYNCSSLLYVYVPKAVKIKANAFRGCTNLSALVIEQTNSVCTLDTTSAFTNSAIASGTGYVYVPDSLVDDYKTATNWSTYAAQIKPLSEYSA